MMKIVRSWLDGIYRERERTYLSKWYGRSYSDYSRACDIYYPIPINYIVRYGLNVYWRFLRIFWWIGLIDTPEGCIFLWSDFYRIKMGK